MRLDQGVRAVETDGGGRHFARLPRTIRVASERPDTAHSVILARASRGAFAVSTPAVLNVGFYNYVMTDKIVALVSADSAPMRRLVQSLRKSGKIIDATQGRRTKSVLFTTGEEVVLSAISQETLAKRLNTGEMVPDEE
ncbi:MAG: DUF370 domain-containing protein [Fimbriimonadaceae bacterium]|nr:DUF370 domain-containing protein [Fimbriimonadaceae bacterium]